MIPNSGVLIDFYGEIIRHSSMSFPCYGDIGDNGKNGENDFGLPDTSQQFPIVLSATFYVLSKRTKT
jgi:hypothetical protein